MNVSLAKPRPGVERIAIESRDQWLNLRQTDVTASVAGALLGVHDYVTAYGLWALKAGKIGEDPEETPAMKRGRLLEPVAMALLKEQHPDWMLMPPGAYYRDPAARLGATPDLFAVNDQGLGVVQIKSVEPSVFRRKWCDEDSGEVQPPLWIAVQAIVEAHLTGAQWAAAAALVVGHGLDLHLVPVPIHAGVIDRVKAAASEFWRHVENGEPPQPDYARDGAVIASLYDAPQAGATVDLTGDNRIQELLAEREKLIEIESDAAARRKAINNEILAKMGDAECARVPGWKLTAKIVTRKAHSVAASSFRQVRASRDDQQKE